MTINEFNKKYRISVLVQATQEVELSEETTNEDPDDILSYGSIDDILENINYAVYDRDTHVEVFLVDTDVESYFLQELKDEFDITDLKV